MFSTLYVGLQVPGQLHGEDGVEEGGDESGVQAAHRPEHFEQQQPQRHTVLLQEGNGEQVSTRCTQTRVIPIRYDRR